MFNFGYLSSGLSFYVREVVRICGYFSKPRGVLEQESLGNTGIQDYLSCYKLKYVWRPFDESKNVEESIAQTWRRVQEPLKLNDFLHTYKYITKSALSHCSSALVGPRPTHCWGLEITINNQTHHFRYDSSGRISALRRYLYLTTHKHKRQTSIPLVRFEPAIPATGLRLRGHQHWHFTRHHDKVAQ